MTEIRHEVEVDTKLADISARVAKQEQLISYAKSSLMNTLRIRVPYRGVAPSLSEVIEAAEAKALEADINEWTAKSLNDDLDKISHSKIVITQLQDEAAPLNAEFNSKQWSRFFLVNNVNGHIHSSMNCSTCTWTTSFGWLPELSGLTEKDAVEEHGAILCTVCYPSAPSEYVNGISKVAQAEKDARAALKAERAAAKIAKGIAALDGSPLKDDMGYTIKTEVTARREMSSAFKNTVYYGDTSGKYAAYARRLAEAIANKTGEDVEELLTTTETKAVKAARKEMS